MTTLYVSDLDGTLLRNDGSLSDFARETLNSLIEEGLLFAVASARSIVTIREVLAGLLLRLPIIEGNGAALSDQKTGAHQVVNPIDSDLLEDLYAEFVDRGCEPLVATFDGQADRCYYDGGGNEGMKAYIRNRTEARDPRLRRVADVREAFRDQVMTFTLIERHAILAPVVEWLETAHRDAVRVHFFEDTYMPEWSWAMVHDRRASKDQAIRTIQEICGVGPEETVVFGDNDNDIAMFRAAGRAIAVSNATDRLKAEATQIVGSNEKDSVVRFIEREFRGGPPNRSDRGA
ncbi:HAD family hydrolase [Candidatus Sumerlaeota bacterium]|nr:HAD family hydrolase [Candidatus Sumerlaeota bacterium]